MVIKEECETKKSLYTILIRIILTLFIIWCQQKRKRKTIFRWSVIWKGKRLASKQLTYLHNRENMYNELILLRDKYMLWCYYCGMMATCSVSVKKRPSTALLTPYEFQIKRNREMVLKGSWTGIIKALEKEFIGWAIFWENIWNVILWQDFIFCIHTFCF